VIKNFENLAFDFTFVRATFSSSEHERI